MRIYAPEIEEFYRLERLEHEAAIDRNCRILKLAEHNGFEIEISPTRCGEYRIWHVPSGFLEIAGAMALLVR